MLSIAGEDTAVGELTPIRYRGYYQDVETGLYYLQSRYYDPTTMRFINADDPNVIQMGTEEKQELNLYVYCLNDPVNCVDPTGYDAVFLLAKYGAYGFGHAALLVSANNQWYYFSLNGEDSGRTNYNLRWYGSKNSVNGFTSASTITGQLKKYSGLARHVYTHKKYIYIYTEILISRIII